MAFHGVGRIVAMNDWQTGKDLFDAAIAGEADAVRFIELMCSLRQSQRRPLHATVLMQQYRDTLSEDAVVIQTGYKQLYFCLRSFYAVYVGLRHIAAPMRQVQEREQMHWLSRQQRRVLAPSGLVRHRAASVHQRAREKFAELWDEMRGAQCILWADNFYKLRFGVNPGFSDLSLNATAFAVSLNVRPLGPFHAYPSILHIYNRLPYIIHQLLRTDRALVQYVRDAFNGVERDSIRVPLDVPRGRCRGQKWRPYQLSDFSMSSLQGLLNTILEARVVSRHTGHVVPLLMDENGHYRLMRWIYGRPFRLFSVREDLNQLVPVYGVWHPYKFLCLHVHREFFFLFIFLSDGQLNADDKVSCVQHLALIERLIAATWIAGGELIEQLDAEIVRITAYFDGVSTRERSNTRRVPRTQEEERVWLNDMFANRQPGKTRKMLPARLWALRQLRLLISEFCPALFLLGFRVRSCTWKAQGTGTATYAKDVLSFSLSLLLRLSDQSEPPLRYTRTVATALMTWTSWHDTSPGCVHVEESCEAMLSKMTRHVRMHRHAATHQQHEDLFLDLPTARTRARHHNKVQERVLKKVRDHMFVLIHTQCIPMMVHWTPRLKEKAVAIRLPARVVDAGPQPLLVSLPRSAYRVLLERCLLTLISGRDLSPGESQIMASHFLKRTDPDLTAHDCMTELVLQKLNPNQGRRIRRRLA